MSLFGITFCTFVVWGFKMKLEADPTFTKRWNSMSAQVSTIPGKGEKEGEMVSRDVVLGGNPGCHSEAPIAVGRWGLRWPACWWSDDDHLRLALPGLGDQESMWQEEKMGLVYIEDLGLTRHPHRYCQFWWYVSKGGEGLGQEFLLGEMCCVWRGIEREIVTSTLKKKISITDKLKLCCYQIIYN